MSDGTPRVQVHLLDPIPGVVVARVLDGLRARGLDAELLGNDTPAGTQAPPRPRVCLSCGRPAPARADRRTAVVTIPATVASARFDRSIGDRVLADVLQALGGLSPAG